MITKLSKAIKTISVPMIMLVGFAAQSYADDTEIYFNDKQKKVKPNVLFILDRSASMNEDPDGKAITNSSAEAGAISKLNLLKESLQLIFSEPSVSGFRVGIMDFGSGRPNLAREVLDVDEIDPTRNIDIISTSPGKTTFRQRVWINTDDGYQNGETHNNWLTFNNGLLRASPIRYFAYRFDNILIKNKSGDNGSGEGAPNYGIESAKLQLYFETTTSTTYQKQIDIYVDPVANSQYLRQRTKDDFSLRYMAAKAKGSDYKKVCQLPRNSGYQECDVTGLVRKIISSNDWEDGNAITFIIVNSSYRLSNNGAVSGGDISFNEASDGKRRAFLNITAKDNAIAKNKRTRKESLLDTTFAIRTSGSTHINRALYGAGLYVSNIPKDKGDLGPYHTDAITSSYSKGSDVTSTESPLLAACQLTHFILMSDGQPTSSYYTTIRDYMGQKSKCYIDGVQEKYGKSAEQCGRSFAYWLTKTDQSVEDDEGFKGPNYIYTHTIGFGMGGADEDEENGENGGLEFDPSSKPFKYLEDLAGYGHGQFHQTKDIDGLVEAFKSIISEALSVNGAAVSGQVVATAKDAFDQRREVFYSLFQSQLLDYWPGNVKGFKLVYQKVTYDNGVNTEIPVLSGWYDTAKKAIGSDGNIASGVDSAWSLGSGDGGNVNAGGVVAQLPNDPASRNMFTFDGHSKKMINSSASLSTAQLGLDSSQEDVKKGLLDFIRGYTFNLNGSTIARGKKIGDAISSGVTLVSYGCGSGQAITECPYENLNLVGLSAANDGIFRGYNLTDGKALYEIMPKELLPIIKKLQKPAQINEAIDPKDPTKGKVVKSYGLDGKVIVYHNDINKNDYIDNGEVAYAFVASGRGGPYIYGFDISNKTNPKLLWSKSDKDLSKLGDTWSEPVTGKIKVNGVVTPVVIFAGGYDKTQNDSPVQKTDDVGWKVFILDARTGVVLADFNEDKMQYSIPGGIATFKGDKDNPELITDLFFGDMGGQLWRFKINNSDVSGLNIVQPAGGKNGLIASISGSNRNNTRRFYQKPFIYDFSAEGHKDASVSNMLAINIGTGYKAHPLVTGNEDRFYSIRIPKDATAASTHVVDENDLAVLTLNYTGTDNYIETGGSGSLNNGFMIKLNPKDGEKVISNPYAVKGRVAFNTYIPDNSFNPTNCIPNAGKARYYIIDIVSGKNLLNTKFVESEISTIPNDVTVYCSDNACSLVSGTHMLDGDKKDYDIGRGFEDSKEKCTADAKECNPSNWGKEGGKIVKTTWTDMFHPEGKN